MPRSPSDILRELLGMLRVDHSDGPEWPMLYIEPPGRPGIHKLAALLAEADDVLAAGAEAEANRREDAKSERLAVGAPNANSGSLPPLALAPGGREEPFAWWGMWNKEYVFGKTRDYVEQRLSWIRADFPKTDIVSASPLYLRPQPPSAPRELLEALKAVVAIADRETNPFIHARALIAKYEPAPSSEQPKEAG